MTPAAHQYTSEIRRALDFNATWFPNTQLSLGTVGELDGTVFRPLDNVTRTLGILVEPEVLPPQQGANLLYQSQSGVSIQTKASGATSALFKALAEVDAGIGITFNRRGACVLSLLNYRTERIANQVKLRRSLLKRADEEWRSSYAVITEIVLASSGTVLVCEDDSAYIELSTKGTLTNPLADLGSASLGFQVSHTEGHIFTVVGASNLTPLFRGVRIKRNWLLQREVGSLGGEDGPKDVEEMSDEEVAQAFEPLEL